MTTMADLDAIALSMPGATKEVSEDRRPAGSTASSSACIEAAGPMPSTRRRASDSPTY